MNKGFTLIELMVATVVLLLFTGGTIVTMSTYMAKQKALGVRSDIKSNINMIKNYASTMQYSTVAAPDTPAFYKIKIGSTITSLVRFVSGSESTFPSTYNSEGLTVSMDASAICFTPFTAVQNACDVGDTGDKVVTISGNYQLKVDKDGQVFEIN